MSRKVLVSLDSNIGCEEEDCQMIAHLLEYFMKVPKISFKFAWLRKPGHEDKENPHYGPYMLIDLDSDEQFETFLNVVLLPITVEFLTGVDQCRGAKDDVTLKIIDENVDIEQFNEREARDEEYSQNKIKECFGILGGISLTGFSTETAAALQKAKDSVGELIKE